MTDFNFDEWASLAKNFPEEFEKKRREVLEKEILKAPIQYRENLRILQMECDAYHNNMEPMAALGAMGAMMHVKLDELNSSCTELAITAGKVNQVLEAIKKINNG